MFCNKCGAQIDDDSVFCNRCGNKIPSSALAIDDEYEYEDEAKYSENIRDDYEYESDEDLISFKFMGVDFNFPYDYTIAAYAADEIAQVYLQTDNIIDDIFDDVNFSIEAVNNKVIPAFFAGYNSMADAFHKVLLTENCVHISCDAVYELFANLYTESIHKELEPFFSAMDTLSDFADTLRSYRSVERASRGKWRGGGFGLGGAIKGAINAGILNAGTNLVHAIGDSITDSRDREEYRRLDKKLYKSLEPISRIKIILLKTANMVIKMLHLTLQGNNCFEDDIVNLDLLCSIDTECDNRRRIIQNINVSKQNVASFWRAYSDRISAYPFNPYAYVEFVFDAHFNFSELENVYPFAGIGILVMRLESLFVATRFIEIFRHKESTKDDIEYKIRELKWLSTSSSSDNNIDDEIIRLQNKLSQMR